MDDKENGHRINQNFQERLGSANPVGVGVCRDVQLSPTKAYLGLM